MYGSPIELAVKCRKEGFMIDFIATFLCFFAVIDPIGTVPVFIALTSQEDESGKRNIALIATPN